jgi:hypothetical protein
MDGWGWPGCIDWCIESKSVPIIVSENLLDWQRHLVHKKHCLMAKTDGSDIVAVTLAALRLTEQETNTMFSELEKFRAKFLSPSALLNRFHEIIASL